MDLEDIEKLFDSKIDPIKETISRLEKQQERIVDIVSNQAVMMNTIKHIESFMESKIDEANKIHDTLFSRMRETENKVSELKDKGSDKIWDIIKLLIAGGIGAIGARIGWR